MERIKHLLKKRVRKGTLLWNCLAMVNRLFQLLFKKRIAQNKIRNHIKNLESKHELKVIFGGHWYDTDEWLILSEEEQDIRQPLKFVDESVNVIFTEHVIEHVDFLDAVVFMQESIRILKKGGVFRIVCPTIERLISVKLNDENGKRYVQNCLIGVWSDENKLLNELRLNGVYESPEAFLLNSMFTKYGHRFIWSRELMVKVLKAIGFHQVSERKVGEGINKEYCIERRRRGVYLGNDWRVDQSMNIVHDPESQVVEAIK